MMILKQAEQWPFRVVAKGGPRVAMPLLYHHTSPEAAEAIRKERKFHAPQRPGRPTEEYTYFSNSNVPNGWGSGFGPATVEVDVPEEDFKRDFELDPYDSELIERYTRLFPDEEPDLRNQVPYRALSDKIRPEWIKR